MGVRLNIEVLQDLRTAAVPVDLAEALVECDECIGDRTAGRCNGKIFPYAAKVGLKGICPGLGKCLVSNFGFDMQCVCRLKITHRSDCDDRQQCGRCDEARNLDGKRHILEAMYHIVHRFLLWFWSSGNIG